MLNRYLRANPNDTYRVAVLGSSGTGKTHKVSALINDHIAAASATQPVFVFTFYKSMYPDPYPTSRLYLDPTPESITSAIDTVNQTLAASKKTTPQFIFIFDDVVDEKLSKSTQMTNLFLTSRKARINIFFVIQTYTVFLTPHMKNNLTHYILFPIFEINHQKRIIHEVIAPVYLQKYRKDLDIADKKSKDSAKKLYSKLFNSKYSSIGIDIRARDFA